MLLVLCSFLFIVIVTSYNNLIPKRLPLTSLLDSKNGLSPRKSLFFDIIEAGLEDKFGVMNDNNPTMTRISKWLKFAKNEIELPKPTVPYHEYIEEYIVGLTAQPWWHNDNIDNLKLFEWIKPLEESNEIIKAELEKVLEVSESFKGDSKYMKTMGEGWQAIRLQRMGEWNEMNSLLFPKTVRIIRGLQIPLAVRGVMFAKQKPRSGVAPHSDGRNFILTAHLGVKIPKENEKVWMKVGGIEQKWNNGQVLVFDTSFTHETFNDTDEDRYVLIIDFWHPDLSKKEREALEYIYDARNKFENNAIKDITSSYISSGKPININDYLKSKEGIGKSFVDFFQDGGLIKFNPFK